MKQFKFDHEPTFAELWDVCVYKALYVLNDYKKDLEKLFEKTGITKESQIVDVSAGGGFPSLDLIKEGYNITCVDGFDDQVELFNKKSKQESLKNRCVKSLWSELPKIFKENSFNFLFCRGNSFIYADGGWNDEIEIKEENSVENYKKTLKIFYNLLKEEGYIYIDKFKDTETTHYQKVGELIVDDGDVEDLIFWTERSPENKIRRASMIRKKNGIEKKTPNVTYDLSSQELESFLSDVGFREIQKINIDSEKHFDVWIAKK